MACCAISRISPRSRRRSTTCTAAYLTGVLGQLANFEGVAEIIRGCQECMQPWGDNEPVDLEYSQRDLVSPPDQASSLETFCRPAQN
jgi:hypothetical protein